MHRTNIGANQVPPGALVSFLQRGIQYVEMQSNLNEVCLPALPCIDARPLFASALSMSVFPCLACNFWTDQDQCTHPCMSIFMTPYSACLLDGFSVSA